MGLEVAAPSGPVGGWGGAAGGVKGRGKGCPGEGTASGSSKLQGNGPKGRSGLGAVPAAAVPSGGRRVPCGKAHKDH